MSFREDSRVQAAIELVKKAQAVQISEASSPPNALFEQLDQKLLNLLREQTGGIHEALGEISIEAIKGIGIPEALAKTIVKILKGNGKGTKVHQGTARDRLLKARMASELSPTELVSEVAKAPFQRNSKFYLSLAKLVGKERVMVWVDGVLHLQETTKRVLALSRGEELRDVVTVDGEVVEAIRLGEKPTQLRKEHPLVPGTYLYDDGTCENGIEWGKLNFKKSRFLAFLVSKGVLKSTTPIENFKIFECASSDQIFALYANYVPEFNRKNANALHTFSSHENEGHDSRRLERSY